MSYYYVKSPGSGSPSGTTKQSGSWPSAYYANIAAAITGGAGAGDVIVCSDSHAASISGNYQILGPTGGVLTIVSVSDSACDTYSPGASETTTSNGDITFNTGFISSSGVDYIADDWFYITAVLNLVFRDCTLTLTNSTNLIQFSGDGCGVRFDNCTLDLNHDTNRIQISSGSIFRFFYSTLAATTSGSINEMFEGTFNSGGGGVYIANSDVSVVSGGTQYIIGNAGSDPTADDVIDVVISNTKIGASTPIVEEQLTNTHHNVTVTNSSPTSAAAEYQYYHNTRGGIIEDDTSFYRDDSTAFPSGTKISLKLDTDSNAASDVPFWFKFPTRFAELSSTASDSLTIYLLCADSLTDADVWVEVAYMDGTNKNVANAAVSVANGHTEMRTSSALTSDTSTWTGRTTENRYKITVDTSGDVGADCVPDILVYVKKETVIWFCTDVDLS